MFAHQSRDRLLVRTSASFQRRDNLLAPLLRMVLIELPLSFQPLDGNAKCHDLLGQPLDEVGRLVGEFPRLRLRPLLVPHHPLEQFERRRRVLD